MYSILLLILSPFNVEAMGFAFNTILQCKAMYIIYKIHYLRLHTFSFNNLIYNFFCRKIIIKKIIFLKLLLLLTFRIVILKSIFTVLRHLEHLQSKVENISLYNFLKLDLRKQVSHIITYLE